MIRQTAFKLITTLALLASVGGCTIKLKEQTKQAPIATPSTSKEDKEATKQKQIAYLKEHEKEIIDFVKSKNSKMLKTINLYQFLGTDHRSYSHTANKRGANQNLLPFLFGFIIHFYYFLFSAVFCQKLFSIFRNYNLRL